MCSQEGLGAVMGGTGPRDWSRSQTGPHSHYDNGCPQSRAINSKTVFRIAGP